MCNGDGASGNPLETLIGAIQGFSVVRHVELTPYDLGEHLIRLRHAIDLLDLHFATDASAFASTDEYIAQGSTSVIDWIRHHCNMSGHAASRAVTSGDQLGRLSRSVGALDAGDIGFAHFSLLASVSRALSRPRSEELDGGDPTATGANATDPGTLGADGRRGHHRRQRSSGRCRVQRHARYGRERRTRR
jgi:hypothetical protein